MALTKKQRDAMPDSDFAVPSKRALPIHDEVHVRMAHSMLDKTKDLSPAEKADAQKRILNRAKKLGMDTSDWDKSHLAAAPDANEPGADDGDLNDVIVESESDQKTPVTENPENGSQMDIDDREKMKHELEKEQEEKESAEDAAKMHGMSLSALAMEFPEAVKDHPNQAPFKGVLTRIDEPSDNPLSGSSGKCVILPREVAEKALPTLIGMAVDFTEGLDGHDARQKIGLITAATIAGNTIEIAGFFYSADFPSEVKRIQAEKARLGFSFEAQAQVRSMNDDPLVIKNCVFTGAAVLYKDMAAYTTTSLAANKTENHEMNEELKKLIEDMSAKIDSLETKLAASQKMEAGNISHMVKPHTDKLRACADGMEAAGMGMHAKGGHVAVLRGMADNMDAEAAVGKMPHIYQTNDFYSASADKKEDSAEMKKIAEKIESMNTKLVDMEKARFAAAAAPERKTLTPAISKLLAKAGIKTDENDGKTSIAELDKHLKASGMSNRDRIAVKLSMRETGQLS